jgi:hypothetical protein
MYFLSTFKICLLLIFLELDSYKLNRANYCYLTHISPNLMLFYGSYMSGTRLKWRHYFILFSPMKIFFELMSMILKNHMFKLVNSSRFLKNARRISFTLCMLFKATK